MYRDHKGFEILGPKISPKNQPNIYFVTAWEYCLEMNSQAHSCLQINSERRYEILKISYLAELSIDYLTD